MHFHALTSRHSHEMADVPGRVEQICSVHESLHPVGLEPTSINLSVAALSIRVKDALF